MKNFLLLIMVTATFACGESGFGDRAYRSPIYDITVLKGRYEVSVDISHKGADADFEKAKEVTPEVLSRLP